MRMIEKMIRAMQDTGMIDGMSEEDADTLAMAALEGLKDRYPTDEIVDQFDRDNCHMTTYHCIGDAWNMMIDAALNE